MAGSEASARSPFVGSEQGERQKEGDGETVSLNTARASRGALQTDHQERRRERSSACRLPFLQRTRYCAPSGVWRGGLEKPKHFRKRGNTKRKSFRSTSKPAARTSSALPGETGSRHRRRRGSGSSRSASPGSMDCSRTAREDLRAADSVEGSRPRPVVSREECGEKRRCKKRSPRRRRERPPPAARIGPGRSRASPGRPRGARRRSRHPGRTRFPRARRKTPSTLRCRIRSRAGTSAASGAAPTAGRARRSASAKYRLSSPETASPRFRTSSYLCEYSSNRQTWVARAHGAGAEARKPFSANHRRRMPRWKGEAGQNRLKAQVVSVTPGSPSASCGCSRACQTRRAATG